MTGLLVSPDFVAYLFDPCEPTDKTPAASTRGIRPVCALLFLLMFGSAAPALEAQERRYLIELGAGGLYQSFDSVTELGSTVGGLGRVGVWLPYNFSVEGEGAFISASTDPGKVGVSVRTLSASVLYNLFLGNRDLGPPEAGRRVNTSMATPVPTPDRSSAAAAARSWPARGCGWG